MQAGLRVDDVADIPRRAADDAHYPGLGALLELGMNPDGGGP